MFHSFLMLEDIELKRLIATPSDEKPRFSWSELFEDCDCCFSKKYVAEVVGEAIVNVLLSVGESDIFTEENKLFVKKIVDAVESKLLTIGKDKINNEIIAEVIEEMLVKNGKNEYAKAFVQKKKFDSAGANLENNIDLKLIRRNGTVVPWLQEKVEKAIELAFFSLKMDTQPALVIADAVTKNIQDSGLSFINIEDVQDKVQEELMKAGFFKVAEAYILYRAKKNAERENDEDLYDDFKDKDTQSMIFVIKDQNGNESFWNVDEMLSRIDFAYAGLESHISRDDVFVALRKGIQSSISIVELKNIIIQNARKLIEHDPVFAIFASRIQLSYLYEEIFGWNCDVDSEKSLQQKQQEAFIKYINEAASNGILNSDILTFDIKLLAEHLDVSVDMNFDAIAMQSLIDHYLMVDDKLQILETPQMFWMRVAIGVFIKEPKSEQHIIELYNVLKDKRFCFATQTLCYAGTPKAQMMSSYIYNLNDDLESVMERGISDNAFIAKWGGGIGGSWTNVRGKGSLIKGTRGYTPGVLPFLNLHMNQLSIANQGDDEHRRGKGSAYLELWHSDVLEFIDFKKHNTNFDGSGLETVLWIPDLFMKRLEKGLNWSIFKSNEVSDLIELCGESFEQKYLEFERKAENNEIFCHKVSSKDLWQKIMQRIFETGYPKIAFKDTCNKNNMCKRAGFIHSGNLCLEHMMNTSYSETAVCNSGSINISKHIKDSGSVDFKKLSETIRIATRALDSMIDANYFPTKASKIFAEKYRAIGLGLMGLQNALYYKELPFDDNIALEFSDDIFEFICHETINMSADLAAEKGRCPVFMQSEWANGVLPVDAHKDRVKKRQDWEILRNKIKQTGIRNAYLNAVSPTRKIALLMSCYPGVLPATSNVFTKTLGSGYELMVINPELVRKLKKCDLWNKEINKQIIYFEGELAAIDEIPENIKKIFSTAFLIDSDKLIEYAATRQCWLDQSQAMRLFLPTPNLRVLSSMFVKAWENGVKGIYEVKAAGFLKRACNEIVDQKTQPSILTDKNHRIWNALDTFTKGFGAN